MKITILKPNEMADHLGIKTSSLQSYVRKGSIYYDQFFPVVKIGSTTRFVKEKVVDYLERINKSDRILEKQSHILKTVKKSYILKMMIYF